jgi:hypothetical protein
MRQAVGFPGGSIGRQREYRALSVETRRGVVLVQLEDWGERLARVPLNRICVPIQALRDRLRVGTRGGRRMWKSPAEL